MPTAFVASYGEGRPAIAVLGEYDALPGLSQKAVPERAVLVPGAARPRLRPQPLRGGEPGRGGRDQGADGGGKLAGTVRYYGTPAEEAVGGKIYMIRAGLFRDVDVALAWHPADRTRADMEGGQAVVDVVVEFHGRTAHAAFDPWNGRSALDAAELFTHGVNMMREHVKPSVRMHYVIPDGGDVPNVVPDHAKALALGARLRAAGVDDVLARLRKVAEGAASTAGVTEKITVQSGDYEMLVNEAGERLLDANLRRIGPLAFTPGGREVRPRAADGRGDRAERDGHDHRAARGAGEGGRSTDVGDVELERADPPRLGRHRPARRAGGTRGPVVAAGGMSIGHKGMALVAKTLALTMVDLSTTPPRARRCGPSSSGRPGAVYRAFIPDGPPPVPKAE